jgi:hypothetical protein
MRTGSGLLLLAVTLLSGCQGYQTTPIEVVPPVVHWDASYAEAMTTISSTGAQSCHRGIIKMMFEFPEDGEDPDWVKVMLKYEDGALARMDVLERGCGVYIVQLPGLSPVGRFILHIQWLSPDNVIGNYNILIEGGDMRPVPNTAPPVIPDPPPDPAP